MTKPSLGTRLKALLEEYGKVAVVTYAVLFVVVFAGFAFAIQMGFEPKGTAAQAGTLGTAWVATKLTQPLRIGATLLLTPIVSRIHQKWRTRN
jgi:hypothetical protein